MRQYLFGLICLFAIGAVAGQTDPQPRQLDWWFERHEQFKANTATNSSIPIIFFGDSNTQYWSDAGRPVFDQYYAPLGVVNYGIGGDAIQHLHWRIINGEVEGLNPRVVVVKIGSNNLGQRNGTLPAIAQGIVSVVRRLRQRLPTTRIILVSIPPHEGLMIFDEIVLVNTMIRGVHDGENIFFLDLFDQLRSDVWGLVQPHLFSDGVHLTTAGYQLWADNMNPLLNKLLQD